MFFFFSFLLSCNVASSSHKLSPFLCCIPDGIVMYIFNLVMKILRAWVLLDDWSSHIETYILTGKKKKTWYYTVPSNALHPRPTCCSGHTCVLWCKGNRQPFPVTLLGPLPCNNVTLYMARRDHKLTEKRHYTLFKNKMGVPECGFWNLSHLLSIFFFVECFSFETEWPLKMCYRACHKYGSD